MTDIPIRVVPDGKHQNMYRLQWADGELSADMYNLQRAKDILRNYAAYRERMRMWSRPQNRRFGAVRRRVVSEIDA